MGPRHPAVRQRCFLPLQFIIAMVAYAINERMARRLEYLLEEVRVLREVYAETTGQKRIPFTDEQRRRLAIKRKALTPEERVACCQIVRPSTILTWFRQIAPRSTTARSSAESSVGLASTIVFANWSSGSRATTSAGATQKSEMLFAV